MAVAATTTATVKTTTREAVTLDQLSGSSSSAAVGSGAAGGGGRIDYGCLLGRCGKELGGALLDPRGVHELACLVTCGPSDLACQVGGLVIYGWTVGG